MFRKFLILVILFSGPAWAEIESFGVGAMVGAPTGISLGYRVSRSNMIDAALGWSLGDDVNYHIHGDYLFLRPGALDIDDISLDTYFGIGGRIKDRDTNDSEDDFRLGVRVPLGIHYKFDDPTIEVFGEIAFIMDIIESTTLDFNLALGGRYWF